MQPITPSTISGTRESGGPPGFLLLEVHGFFPVLGVGFYHLAYVGKNGKGVWVLSIIIVIGGWVGTIPALGIHPPGWGGKRKETGKILGSSLTLFNSFIFKRKLTPLNSPS